MHLTSALQNSLSGLRSAQSGMDVVSRNVSNAGTDGYTRKTAPREHVVLDGQGAGVRRLAIERHVDLRIQREMRIERGSSNRLDVTDSFLQRMDQMFGRPDEEVSLASSVQRLSGSFQQLADKPEDPTLRNAALADAQHLAGDLNGMSTSIQQMRLEADQGIVEAVGIVNDALHNIKDLNQEIATRTLSGRSAADLEDQRDRHLDRLTEQMNVQYFSRKNGEVVILTQTGRTLLDTRVHQLQVDGRSVITPQNVYDADPAQRGVATITLSTGAGDVDLLARNEISDGRIAGFIDVRDKLMPQAQDQLDELAHHLATALSVGEVTPGSSVTDISTVAGQLHGGSPVYDPFAADAAAVQLDITLDGRSHVIGPFAVDATSNATVQASIQQALDDNGFSDITASTTGADPNQVLTLSDAQGRKIQSLTLTNQDTGDTVTPTLNFAGGTHTTTIDVANVRTAGDTITLNYALSSNSETRSLTLTAVDPPGTGEPGTFSLGTTEAGRLGNIETAVEDALDDVASGVFNVSLSGTDIVIEDGDLTASTQEIRGVSAAARGADGPHLALFADNSGDGQAVYTGRQPGEAEDQQLGFAQRIAVNAAVADDPSLLTRYTDPATGEVVPQGDPARPLEMLRRLSEATQDFDSSLGLGPVNSTIEGFAVSLVSFQAGQTAQVEDELDYQTAVTESVERRHDAVSGVNVDEEMTELMFLERTYSASAQVLTAVERMLDELLAAVN
jgi:flagellar hook-associated protein 1 FlgK